MALHTSYHAFYAIVDSKEDWVANVWHSIVEGGCWAPSFSKALNDCELDLMEQFLWSLQGGSVCKE